MKAESILTILNIIQSLLNWLTARGVPRDNALALLMQADEEGRDVTTAEVQAELDATQTAIDNTRGIIRETFNTSD